MKLDIWYVVKNLRLQSELEDYIKNRAFIAGLSVADYISKNISKCATNRDFRSEMYTELLPEIMAMCYNNGNNKEIGIDILEFLGLRWFKWEPTKI